MESKEPTET